ncbi:MAG: hypothetical protein M3Y42_03060 [Actinomycetota bacterium]|nr:hypothetical protein [Actinomycetota bacterium]MDQ2955927.1 hypothetical protein [Actinomycetota bacterium]
MTAGKAAAMTRHTLRRITTILASTSLILSCVQSAAFAAPAHDASAPRPAKTKPVPGSLLGARRPSPAGIEATAPARLAAAPAAGSYPLSLPAAGSWTPVGTTGIYLSAAAPAATGVTVQVLDRAGAASRGLTGLVLRLARTDARTATTPIALSVASSTLAGLYGADYAAHLQWTQTADPGTGKSIGAATRLVTRTVPAGPGGGLAAPAVTGSQVMTQRSSASGAVVTTAHLGSSAVLLSGHRRQRQQRLGQLRCYLADAVLAVVGLAPDR